MQVVHATLTGKFQDVETSQKAISKIIRFAKTQGLILCDISNNAADYPEEKSCEAKVANLFHDPQIEIKAPVGNFEVEGNNGMMIQPINKASSIMDQGVAFGVTAID